MKLDGNNWAQWADQEVNMEEQQDDNVDDILEEVQQQEISFDQSGSTAQYLRAHGPDITLNVADVIVGKVNSSSSDRDTPSSSTVASSTDSGLAVQLLLLFQSL